MDIRWNGHLHYDGGGGPKMLNSEISKNNSSFILNLNKNPLLYMTHLRKYFEYLPSFLDDLLKINESHNTTSIIRSLNSGDPTTGFYIGIFSLLNTYLDLWEEVGSMGMFEVKTSLLQKWHIYLTRKEVERWIREASG